MKSAKLMMAAAVLALLNVSAWACGTCAPCKAAKADETAKKACCGTCSTKETCTAKKSCCGTKACKKKCATKCAKSGCATKCTKSADKSACATKCALKAGHKHIDTKTLANKLQSEKDLIILDARSAKWDDGTRIPGAKQLTSKSDAATIASVVGADKNAKIITYCSNTKCKASSKLAAALAAAGYTNVTEYPEGIAGWKAAGNEVVKTK